MTSRGQRPINHTRRHVLTTGSYNLVDLYDTGNEIRKNSWATKPHKTDKTSLAARGGRNLECSFPRYNNKPLSPVRTSIDTTRYLQQYIDINTHIEQCIRSTRPSEVQCNVTTTCSDQCDVLCQYSLCHIRRYLNLEKESKVGPFCFTFCNSTWRSVVMAKINLGYGIVRMPATTNAPLCLRSTELKPFF